MKREEERERRGRKSGEGKEREGKRGREGVGRKVIEKRMRKIKMMERRKKDRERVQCRAVCNNKELRVRGRIERERERERRREGE